MGELVKALESTVSSDQNEAVKYMQEYSNRDFDGFLRALSDVLYNHQNLPVVRAAAGLQLKSQLTARDEALRNQQQEKWRHLPDDTRQYVKERLFRTLGMEMFRPSSVPQCVAYIALLELPEGRWPGLIEALKENVTSPNSSSQTRLASLEAIGYICQDMDQLSLSDSEASSILAATSWSGVQDSKLQDLRLAATNALLQFSANKILSISKSTPQITFQKLGELLNVEPRYAEQIVAQMIREERLKGHLDQVEQIVYFETKEVLETFDEEIMSLCLELNEIIEKIRHVVPQQWWITNTQQVHQ